MRIVAVVMFALGLVACGAPDERSILDTCEVFDPSYANSPDLFYAGEGAWVLSRCAEPLREAGLRCNPSAEQWVAQTGNEAPNSFGDLWGRGTDIPNGSCWCGIDWGEGGVGWEGGVSSALFDLDSEPDLAGLVEMDSADDRSDIRDDRSTVSDVIANRCPYAIVEPYR